MRILFASLAAATALTAAAQHSLLTSYDWDPAPAIPDGLRQGTDSDVLLKRNSISQYDDSGQELAFYELFHLQRYAHDEASVEANKTMEISVGHIERIIRIKARSVSADGTVHELGESAFKRRVDDEDNREKLYFAFEGLQRSTRHKSGIAMRFPRVSRLRWDKPPAEADRLETLQALIRD